VNNRILISWRPQLIVFILALAWAGADAADSDWVPKHEGWVTDTARALSNPDRQRLAKMLSQFQEDTHHQLAVLTVPSIFGEPIETFSLRVINSWGLGYKRLNNGILVTLAMKEKMIRIEVGKGMERYISDATAKSIITTTMAPAFARGDFGGGLERGLDRLMEAARQYVIKPTDLPNDVGVQQ
jgi:uncharacterized protein